MTSPSTYQSELQSIMLTYFDTEDLPCEDFTAIYEAYKGRKSLTESEVKASIASVIDEETDLPAELITAVVNYLSKNAESAKGVKVTKGGKVGKAESAAPVEAAKEPKKASSKKSAPAPAATSVVPPVAATSSVVPPAAPASASLGVDVPAKAKRVRKPAADKSAKRAAVAVPTGGSPPPSSLTSAAESASVEPVRPMNNVARFSQMVSHIRNPGAFASEMTALQGQSVTMVDGFKRESGLYTMLETTGLLSHIGQTLTMKALVDDLYAKVPKPAIVTIAAIVRWYLPVAVREQLTSDFVNLNLALPVKVRKAKKSRKGDKGDKDDKKRPAAEVSSDGEGTEAASSGVGKRAKRVKREKNADAVPRELKGYALFTKRIGELLRGVSTPAYMATGIKVSNNYTKPNAHYEGLVQTGVLTLDGDYTLDGLCKLVQTAPFEGKMSVVRVSGLIWGMSNVETRGRLTA
jgi:hypothetical protein